MGGSKATKRYEYRASLLFANTARRRLGSDVTNDSKVYFDRLNRADGGHHGLQKGDGQAKSASRGLATKYTLLVFSDHPGGVLMWRENIKDVGTHKVATPRKWGKITIRLER